MKKFIILAIMIGLFIFGIFFATEPNKTQAATGTPITGCQTIPAAGGYYLANDVSSAGTCFSITISGVTLDLNGKTINYDTVAQGAPTHGITATGAISNLKITNGKMVSGSKDTSSRALYFNNANLSGAEISYLDLTFSGNSNEAIHIGQGSNINIFSNTIHNNDTAIVTRYNYDGYSVRLHYTGNSSIHDNTIIGGQGGIVAAYGSANTTSIYNNDISQDCLGGNCYGILTWQMKNAKIYSNNIHTAANVRGGHGVLIDDSHQNIEVYNNKLDIGVKGIQGEGDNAWGIKVRTCTDGPGSSTCVEGQAFNLQVHDNDIKVTAFTEGDLAYASGLGVYSLIPNLNDRFFNNNITAISNVSTKQGHGLKIGGIRFTGQSGTIISNNTITANTNNIFVATEDQGGGDNLVIASNTLIKGANPINYHTLRYGKYINGNANAQFVDTKTLGGADIDDITYGGDSGGSAYSYYVKWYLDTTVKDTSGNPVAGATVATASTAGGNNPSTITDASGRARLDLTEYFNSGSTLPTGVHTIIRYTPHTITITASGKPTYTTSLNMDTSKEMTVIMGGAAQPPIISNVVAAVDSVAKTATITWQTDKASDSKVDFGETTNYGQTKSVATATTNHSVQLTGIVSPVYHYRVFSKDTTGEAGGADHIFLLTGGTAGGGMILTKSVDKTSAMSGDTLTYTLNYTNGSTNVTSVSINDPIPTGTTFVSANNGGISNGIKVTWTLGNLDAGAIGTVSFNVKIN